MFDRLKEFFRNKGAAPLDSGPTLSAHDKQVAVAVLLLEAAGRDNDYAPEEVDSIFRIMQQRFSLEDDAATQILEVADLARQDKERVDEFFRALRARCSEEEKQSLLAMVWTIILADKKIEKFEERYAAQIQTRLKLTDEQAQQAYKAAKAGKLSVKE